MIDGFEVEVFSHENTKIRFSFDQYEFIINEMFKLYVRRKALVGLEGPELPAKVDFVQQENPSDESVVKAP